MSRDLSPTIGELLVDPTPLALLVLDEYDRPIAELIRLRGEIEGEPLASLVGIPSDTPIRSPRGAKSGPTAVRDGLSSCLCYERGLVVDLADAPPVADYGDVDVKLTNVDETWDRVSGVVEALTALRRALAVIGKDFQARMEWPSIPVVGASGRRPAHLGEKQ